MASTAASTSIAIESASRKNTGATTASSLESPGSVAFSSQPVAPVVTNRQMRRPPSDATTTATSAASSPNVSHGTATTIATAEDDSSQRRTVIENRSSHTPLRSEDRRATRGEPSQSQHSSPSPYSSASGSETEPSSDEHASKSTSRSTRPAQRSSGINNRDSTPPQPQQPQQPQPPHDTPSNAAPAVSLSSISGAALPQLRDGSAHAPSNNNSNNSRPPPPPPLEPINDDDNEPTNHRHSRQRRSRSRDRSVPPNSDWRTSTTAATAPGQTHHHRYTSEQLDTLPVVHNDPPIDVHDDDNKDEPDDDVRILFHGRTIFADDLIGLRVAKTFASHGRFLGQVVKFDPLSLLYTVVYADGDAEELTIDSTLQILLQDDIERVDPSLPPLVAAHSVPPATQIESPDASAAAAAQSLNQRHYEPQTIRTNPRTASSPSTMQISDREAQFVGSLFENHALPLLLRDGWRVVQTAAGSYSTSDQQFIAPPSSANRASRVFPSALAVVEFIASDPALLSACFPANVHAAILSLFREQQPPAAALVTSSSSGGSGSGGSNNHKRTAPGDAALAFDTKRPRHLRAMDDSSSSMQFESRSAGQRDAAAAARGMYYLPTDGDAAGRMTIERDAYAPQSMPPDQRFRRAMQSREHNDETYQRPVAAAAAASAYCAVPMQWPSSNSNNDTNNDARTSSLSPVHNRLDQRPSRPFTDASPEWRDHPDDDLLLPQSHRHTSRTGSHNNQQYVPEQPVQQSYYHYHDDDSDARDPHDDARRSYRSHGRSDAAPSTYYSDHHDDRYHVAAGTERYDHHAYYHLDRNRFHNSNNHHNHNHNNVSVTRQSPSDEHMRHRHHHHHHVRPASGAAAIESTLHEFRAAGHSMPSSRDDHHPASSSPLGGPSFSMLDVDRNAHSHGSNSSAAPSPVEQQHHHQWDARRLANDQPTRNNNSSGYDDRGHSRSPRQAYASNQQQHHHHHHHRHAPHHQQRRHHAPLATAAAGSSNGDSYSNANGAGRVVTEQLADSRSALARAGDNTVATT